MPDASTFTSVPSYLAGVTINEEDGSSEVLNRVIDATELIDLICGDLWLARAWHFGGAGAMDRHIEYLGQTLLPQAEEKLNRMTSEGIMGEAYVHDHWFGETNEEQPHASEEVSFDQQVEDQQNFVAELIKRMKTAGIIMVGEVRAHDLISDHLNQYKYGTIKSKALANRQAREAKAASG